MEKIIFVDTNFLISNIGGIKDIIDKVEKAGYSLYITETVKNEFINIELRKKKDIYNKLEKIKQTNKFINLTYTKEEETLEYVKNKYDKLFNQYFKNRIIEYDKNNMLDRVLERNIFKIPPFFNESNSTDKGFKDTIILLTIKDYIQTLPEESEIYFVTADNGFTKYKKDIEQEILVDTKRNIKIIDARSKETLYNKLNIENEQTEEQKENIFVKNIKEIDIEKIREEINDLMFDFKYELVEDFYGNQSPEKRFKVYTEINYSDTEDFLENIENNIKENIFSKYISPDNLFKNTSLINPISGIDVTTLQKIYNLYIKVKETEYKEAFINFIMMSINENIDYSMNGNSSYDDLPF